MALEAVAALSESRYMKFGVRSTVDFCLFWQACYFPALFSSVLVCSPFSTLSCQRGAGGWPPLIPCFSLTFPHPWYAFLVWSS